MAYEGGCHCGEVAFHVEGDAPSEALSCNCSICRAKGLLLAFVPATDFTLVRGEDALRDYRFNSGRIAHRFCGTCGTQVFSEGAQPDGTAMRAINLRSVTGLDLDSLTLKPFDGASL